MRGHHGPPERPIRPETPHGVQVHRRIFIVVVSRPLSRLTTPLFESLGSLNRGPRALLKRYRARKRSDQVIIEVRVPDDVVREREDEYRRLREFLYVDLQRVRSYYAQQNRGVIECPFTGCRELVSAQGGERW